MRHPRFVIALGAILACPLAAQAGPTKTISPFMSPSFNRTVHGEERAIDLSLGERGLGHAEAFAGLDALSTANKQYLTSGLQWRSGAADTPMIRVSALQTEGRAADLGTSQTLVRAENQLDLGDRWYIPDIQTEIAQVSNSSNGSDTTLGGRAARIGLSEALGPGRLTLGYFQADPTFNALGSSIVAGDRGVELGGSYALGDKWQLSHDLRLHQATALRPESGLVQQWTFSRNAALTDIGRPWQLSAQLGNPGVGSDAGGVPLAVQLAGKTERWRTWRLDTSVGWYDQRMAAPQNLPVNGTMWQVSASRGLNLGGFETELSPTFAFGGSRYDDRDYGSRTGLKLGFSQFSDNIDLSVDYLSDGWSATPGVDNDVQMTLNYTQSTGAIMPSLRSMASTLRLPWVPRY